MAVDDLDTLPEAAYSDDLYDAKCARIYEHVYESYWGDGAGKSFQFPQIGAESLKFLGRSDVVGCTEYKSLYIQGEVSL